MYEKKGRYIVEFEDIPFERQHQIEIEVDERRGNYNEVELGFDEERALQEAKRCLSCRRCLGCALCWAECKPEAIIFEMEDEYYDLEAEAVIVSSGVERSHERIDAKFGLGQHLNVITDSQLARMLSETGPSKGLVIRPYDGEIPASIAFVQGYESASPPMHAAALCLGINEATLVRSKMDGTSNKGRLGANAILGISLAVAKAASDTSIQHLFEYLATRDEYILPVPMLNIINGGVHAGNELAIQEFMIMPLV